MTTLLLLLAGLLTAAHGQDGITNCLTLYEDRRCLRQRGSTLPAKPKHAQVCNPTNSCITTSPDFLESYKFDCRNDSYVEIYRGTTCSNVIRDRLSITPGVCTLLFSGASYLPTTYGILGCDIFPEEDSSTDAFFAALAFNCLLGGAAAIAFLCLKKRFPSVYEPRAMSDIYSSLSSTTRTGQQVISPGTGFLGWFKSTYRLTDEQIYEACGLDAAMYTMLYRSMFWLFAVCGVYSLVVILPLNVHGTEGADGIEQMSMANIETGSALVWAHWIGMCLFSVMFMYQLDILYRKFVTYRVRHLNHAREINSIVLVQDIPLSCRDDEALAAYYSEMYPDVIAAARIRDVDELSAIAHKRMMVATKLEQAIYKSQKTGQDPTTRANGGCTGPKVPAEDHFRQRLAKLNVQYATARKNALSNPINLPAGFVAFKSHRSATLAAQALHSSKPHSWHTSRCPDPDDIVFDNLEITSPQRATRTAFVAIATGALVVLWVLPATLVASITTLETLDLWANGLEAYQNVNPIAQGIVQGVIPTILLLLFMSVLPAIMQYLSHKEGIVTKSQIARSAMSKLVWFQMINVYAVSIVAGSILDIADELSHDPRALWDLLGRAIPRTGVFFTTYVMLRGISGYPLALLRVGEWIGFATAGLFSAHTPREKEQFRRAEVWDVSLAAAGDVLVFAVGITYAIVFPLIIPFMLIYFGLGYLAVRYMLYYVYLPTPRSGGLLWPLFFNRLMVALLIAQLTFTGVLSVKEAPTAASSMVVLVAATFWFWHRTGQGLQSVGSHLPLEAAVHAPDNDSDTTLSQCIQPVMRQSDELTIEQLSQPELSLSELPVDTIASRLYYEVGQGNESGLGLATEHDFTAVGMFDKNSSQQKLLPFEEA
eukprot:m.92709 g.92709  ORF g.92709 m.92709 type:complete len:881 (-) comp14957_c0_seq1:70-2712(-)